MQAIRAPTGALRLPARLPTRVGRCQAKRSCPVAQAGSGKSLDLQQSADVELDSLERLYLSETVPPPAAAEVLAAQSSTSEPSGKKEQQALRQKHHHERHHHEQHEEVCGKLACAQHVERRQAAAAAASPPASDDTANATAAAPEDASAGQAGFLGRLLDMLPLSPRTRGIVMLNLLVLLVATNWVRGAPWCQRS